MLKQSCRVTVGAQMQALAGFTQHFGQVLGVAVGGAILQNSIPHRLPENVAKALQGNGEIVYALIEVMPKLSEADQKAVSQAVTDSLRLIWTTMAIVSGVGFILSFWVSAACHIRINSTTDAVFLVESKSLEGRNG